MWIIALTLFLSIIAYLCGSFSSAIIVCKLFKVDDPRTVGSKNPGATNVLRIGGPLMAFLVLFLDMLKGAVPVYLSYRLGVGSIGLGIIAISASLGHIYPLFFNFVGGKGVATALGTMLPIGWDFAGSLLVTWIILLLITNYSSLASILTSIAAPFISLWLDDRFVIPIAMLSFMIVFKHKDNIVRLYNKTEPKLKFFIKEE